MLNLMLKICKKHGAWNHLLYKVKYYRCAACAYDAVKRYRKNLKLKCIEYKGGKCSVENCGYKKCPEALEFHHIDPIVKDFSISAYKNKSWNVIKKELDKCIIVCANCHREIHYNLGLDIND